MSTARTLITEQEFLALPEGTAPAELLDGEVIVAPSPGYWHQELLGRMVQALRAWARDRPDVTVVQAPLDVRFGEGRILQPDAMVFGRRLLANVDSPIDQVPLLCVEVLSKNRAYDRITKGFVYAEAGVREYWLVEPSGLIERRSGEGLSEVEELTSTIDSPLLPGFVLNLEDLFRRA